jgi:uncharacterized protein YkwD
VAPRRTLLRAALAALAVGILAGGTPAFAAGHTHAHATSWACADAGLTPTKHDIVRIRAAVVCLINRERVTRGEHSLRVNAHLQRAAQRHTFSMAFRDYFEHRGPGGQTPLTRMRKSGYIRGARAAFAVGENIAWGTLYLATPSAIVAAWMASPDHRANILNPRFRDTAIGVSAHVPWTMGHGQHGAIYTQDFGVVSGR